MRARREDGVASLLVESASAAVSSDGVFALALDSERLRRTFIVKGRVCVEKGDRQ